MLRKIVKIDPDKCNGCGLCASSCVEGAITIVDGKAVLSADNLCDGLGACLGECPLGAITIEEREADAFDEAAVEQALNSRAASGSASRGVPAQPSGIGHRHEHGGGCPGSRSMVFAPDRDLVVPEQGKMCRSQLGQWPVQLSLVSTSAPYFQGADLLITADCVPVAYAGYHEDFLQGKAVVMGCPKLDDNNFYQHKLTELFSKSDIKSVTVLRMEVPCCGGIAAATRQALAASGKQIPYHEVLIGIQGSVRKSS